MTQARAGAAGGPWRRVAAVLALTGLVAAGCSGAPETEPAGDAGDTAGGQATGEQDTADPTEAAPEGLDRYYSQQVQWSGCEDFECAQVEVPLDYGEPDGKTIQLQLLRVPATGDRIGSLLINPGGPGVSGVDYARSADMAFGEPVRRSYDIVGFDPRGVGDSAPISCVDGPQLDELLGADPTPETTEERAEAEQVARQFAQACQQNVGALLANVSTVEAARDLDIVRAALGEEKLDYLGSSYGTYLGTTYAELFPDRVGRMVLDGAIDPTLDAVELSLGQAEGFERATRAYLEDCVESGDCPLGEDVESARQRIVQFLEGLDRQPLPVEGDVVTELTEGWGMLGIIVAMYDQAGWPLLSRALEQAFDGDGTMLMYLANVYASRESDGTYTSNTMQAIYAVNCLDRPRQPELNDPEVLERFEEVSPTWGRYLGGEGGVCSHWPVEPQERLEEFNAEGAAPILVVGTTGDPATPHEWAVSLADILDSGVLLSYEGEGHTAYGRSNDCVDDIVHGYLLEGAVPDDGTTC
ncbi:alpha/beta hydrolase [Ornithinicoccus halotolerans]|uniref:alpha/beta hydrolase n=1 Tax=Ornithinicoccus halotolerans TaxID=1748220 RepID=UPI00129782F4|nr:alpha/beta hydrolase [Ornithinicoccus halotolerans]